MVEWYSLRRLLSFLPFARTPTEKHFHNWALSQLCVLCTSKNRRNFIKCIRNRNRILLSFEKPSAISRSSIVVQLTLSKLHKPPIRAVKVTGCLRSLWFLPQLSRHYNIMILIAVTHSGRRLNGDEMSSGQLSWVFPVPRAYVVSIVCDSSSIAGGIPWKSSHYVGKWFTPTPLKITCPGMTLCRITSWTHQFEIRIQHQLKLQNLSRILNSSFLIQLMPSSNSQRLVNNLRCYYDAHCQVR